MFSIDEMLDILTDGDIKTSRKENYLYHTLLSDDFYGWLFNPPKSMNTEKLKENLFNALTRKDNLKALYGMLVDNRTDRFPRTAAVFIFSICNYAVDLCRKDAEDIDRAYKNKEIDKYECREEYEKTDKRFNRVSKINDLCSKIVEHDAKKISRYSGLPMSVVTEALKTVPETDYVSPKKIGFYLNIVNQQLYSSIDVIDDDIEYVKWSEFFIPLFGKRNETEVAMYLTLEGTSRIAKDWKNLNRIHYIWDSLTGYALDVLEKADNSSRNHMLELYTKIISTMNESNKSDLRVDLTSLDKSVFPNITRSVSAIYDRIKEARHSNEIDEGKTVS